MPLTILPDSDVKKVLHSLTQKDILDIQISLADALHYYSTSTETEDNGCCASYQPKRTSLKRKNGSTTLFMPATSNDAMGVKIVTLAEPKRPTWTDDASTSSLSVSSLSISDSNSGSKQSSNPSLSSSTPLSPTAAEHHSSVSSQGLSPRATTPKGSLTLLDRSGNPRALINAEELTAFRTALASTALFKKRANVHDLVVFGAGKQAYWHIRLALLLRGSDVHHLTIVNRSFERAQEMVSKLFKPDFPAVELSHPKIVILTTGHGEYDRLLKETVRGASAIFTTTPSLSPLFPASYLTSTTARVKGRYIAAIGSYKPHMIELHPDVVRQAVAPSHGHHHHKHAKSGGAVIVDSVEACMKEAGEIIQAGLDAHEVVELGELIMLKRDAEKKKAEDIRRDSESSTDSGGVRFGGKRSTKGGKHGDDDGGLGEWLKKGNVIFKSVGIGLMDIVVGSEIVRLANERGLGVHVESF